MNKQQFKLENDYIELIKLLKYMGICETGGQAKIAVDSSLVKVDGEVESRKRRKLRVGNVVVMGNETIEVI